MTEIDTQKEVVAHLKKSLKVLHQALAAATKADYGPAVTGPIRAAISEIHFSLDVVEGRT